MAEIKGNTVIMTRGDTEIIRISIKKPDGTEYEPMQGDRIRFALKRNYDDEDTLILKDIPIATMELKIDPIDTKNLEAGQMKGRYKYDIELTQANGDVSTVIPRADFIILEEVL